VRDDAPYYCPFLAALAYYYDHFAEIRQQIHESEAFIAELMAEIPSVVQRKLKARNVRAD